VKQGHPLATLVLNEPHIAKALDKLPTTMTYSLDGAQVMDVRDAGKIAAAAVLAERERFRACLRAIRKQRDRVRVKPQPGTDQIIVEEFENLVMKMTHEALQEL
jgi:hypothetical protein